MSVLPQLFYFNIIGIGFPIRCLLHCAGVDYKYVDFGIEEWWGGGFGLKYAPGTGVGPLLKMKFPAGTIPRCATAPFKAHRCFETRPGLVAATFCGGSARVGALEFGRAPDLMCGMPVKMLGTSTKTWTSTTHP